MIWKHLIFLAVCVAGFVGFAASRILDQPYFYDEADYMYAVSLGTAANFLDEPARSFPEFVRTGLNRKNNQAALSSAVRQQVDVNFYRHWHGPLYFYWLLLAPGAWDEHAMRAWSLVIPAAAIVLVYVGLLWILPAETRTLGAILGTSLFAFSHTVVSTSELAPHALFAACYLASLLCAAKAMTTAKRNLWHGAAGFAGLAFATLEVTFALILALTAAAWMNRARLGTGFAWMLRPATTFCVTVLVVWPGALLKIAFLKAYLFMAYLAIFRKNAWGDETFWSTWAARLTDSPVEWLLIAVAMLLFFTRRQIPGRDVATPFLLHAGFMMLATIRVNSSGPRYMLPFVPALSVFTGIILAGWLRRESAGKRYRLRIAAPAVIFLLLVARTAWWNSAHPQHPDPGPAVMLSEVRGFLGARKDRPVRLIVAPQVQLPVLHYYFPAVEWRGYSDETAIAALLAESDADAILYTRNPIRLKPLKLY